MHGVFNNTYLGRDVDVARRLSLAAEADGIVLLGAVLLHVLLGTREDLRLLRRGRLSSSSVQSINQSRVNVSIRRRS